MNPGIDNFSDFWVFYVSQHAESRNRWLHFIGTFFTFVVIGSACYWMDPKILILWPVVGYGFAWFGHFVFENNRPATFTYPVWSFVSDYKMFFKILLGQMSAELDRARSRYP